MLLKNFGRAQLCLVRMAFRRSDTPLPDQDIAKATLYSKNKYLERESFPGEFDVATPRGKIYDKKPFKIYLEANKRYNWCTCGNSKSQPICDGSHKRLDGTSYVKTRPLYRPLGFSVTTSDTYYLCNCKRTNNMPFCDGTHKRQDIQDAVKS